MTEPLDSQQAKLEMNARPYRYDQTLDAAADLCQATASHPTQLLMWAGISPRGSRHGYSVDPTTTDDRRLDGRHLMYQDSQIGRTTQL